MNIECFQLPVFSYYYKTPHFFQRRRNTNFFLSTCFKCYAGEKVGEIRNKKASYANLFGSVIDKRRVKNPVKHLRWSLLKNS